MFFATNWLNKVRFENVRFDQHALSFKERHILCSKYMTTLARCLEYIQNLLTENGKSSLGKYNFFEQLKIQNCATKGVFHILL